MNDLFRLLNFGAGTRQGVKRTDPITHCATYIAANHQQTVTSPVHQVSLYLVWLENASFVIVGLLPAMASNLAPVSELTLCLSNVADHASDLVVRRFPEHVAIAFDFCIQLF